MILTILVSGKSIQDRQEKLTLIATVFGKTKSHVKEEQTKVSIFINNKQVLLCLRVGLNFNRMNCSHNFTGEKVGQMW